MVSGQKRPGLHAQTYPSDSYAPKVRSEVWSRCEACQYDKTCEIEEDPGKGHDDRPMVLSTYHAMRWIGSSIAVKNKLIGQSVRRHVVGALLESRSPSRRSSKR